MLALVLTVGEATGGGQEAATGRKEAMHFRGRAIIAKIQSGELHVWIGRTWHAIERLRRGTPV